MHRRINNTELAEHKKIHTYLLTAMAPNPSLTQGQITAASKSKQRLQRLSIASKSEQNSNWPLQRLISSVPSYSRREEHSEPNSMLPSKLPIAHSSLRLSVEHIYSFYQSENIPLVTTPGPVWSFALILRQWKRRWDGCFDFDAGCWFGLGVRLGFGPWQSVVCMYFLMFCSSVLFMRLCI